MEKETHNVLIDENGVRYASVPLWQEIPEITVRIKDGNISYRFTGSFDGTHTLSEKVVELINSEKGV